MRISRIRLQHMSKPVLICLNHCGRYLPMWVILLTFSQQITVRSDSSIGPMGWTQQNPPFSFLSLSLPERWKGWKIAGFRRLEPPPQPHAHPLTSMPPQISAIVLWDPQLCPIGQMQSPLEQALPRFPEEPKTLRLHLYSETPLCRGSCRLLLHTPPLLPRWTLQRRLQSARLRRRRRLGWREFWWRWVLAANFLCHASCCWWAPEPGMGLPWPACRQCGPAQQAQRVQEVQALWDIVLR